MIIPTLLQKKYIRRFKNETLFNRHMFLIEAIGVFSFHAPFPHIPSFIDNALTAKTIMCWTSIQYIKKCKRYFWCNTYLESIIWFKSTSLPIPINNIRLLLHMALYLYVLCSYSFFQEIPNHTHTNLIPYQWPDTNDISPPCSLFRPSVTIGQ